MLATIIPYFLLATVSDKSTWPNGPEFKFDSDINIQMNDFNINNQKNGFNFTNEFICRPKTDTSLQCRLQHKKMIAYEVNRETGYIKSKEIIHPDPDMYKPFIFGIGFDKRGVNRIIVNETLSKFETVLDIAHAMASMLNVAVDMSAVKLSADPVILGQVNHMVLGKCKGDVVANLQPSSEEDKSKDASWDLEMTPPLEKLAGRKIEVMKTWSLADCKPSNKFFWTGMFMPPFGPDSRPIEDEVTVKLININDRITVSRGSFDYLSNIHLRVSDNTIKVEEAKPDNHKDLDILELSRLRLSEVQPALGTWPEIENAVTIDIHEQK